MIGKGEGRGFVVMQSRSQGNADTDVAHSVLRTPARKSHTATQQHSHTATQQPHSLAAAGPRRPLNLLCFSFVLFFRIHNP